MPSREWLSEGAPTTDEDSVFRPIDSYRLSSNTKDDYRAMWIKMTTGVADFIGVAVFLCCVIKASPSSSVKKHSVLILTNILLAVVS